MHVVTFLRTRENLSQNALSRRLGLTPNDICRMENQGYIGLVKMMCVARFFDITVDAVLTNDMDAVAATLSAPVSPNHKVSLQMEKQSVRRIKLGRQGEDWVYRHELEQLKDTLYRNAVNPNFANNVLAGFDILSFTQDGALKYIEVKTTDGAEDTTFSLTENEFQMLQDCLLKSQRYEIYRVFDFGEDPKVKVISGEDLLREYELIPHVSYEVKKKMKEVA